MAWEGRRRLDRPVFIVGGQRSGSSLLYRTLQRLSEFSPGGEHLAEAKLFLRLPDAHRWHVAEPESLVRFMMDDRDAFAAFLEETRHVRRPVRYVSPVLRRLAHRPIPRAVWVAIRGDAITRSYFLRAAAVRGASRLLEKSPGNVAHVEELVSAFPDARLLYIIRHPVDCYASLRRRADADPASAEWAGISPERFVRTWSLAEAQVQRARRLRPDAFMCVRYEDLTGDPEAVLTSVCDHVEAEFTAAAVWGSSSDGVATTADPLLGGPIVQRQPAWSTLLTEEQVRIIERGTEAGRRRFGYRGHLSV